MFDSYFLKLLLKIVFENIKNIVFVLFKNCFCFLNLVFLVFLMFFRLKKGIKHVISIFLVLLIF